jgi:hypothetical protein
MYFQTLFWIASGKEMRPEVELNTLPENLNPH